MKKTILFTFIYFTFQLIIFAQSPTKSTTDNNKALIKLSLMNMKKTKVLPNETILFANQTNKKIFSIKTSKEGKAEIYLDKGFTYNVQFKAIGGDIYDYGPLELENSPTLTGFTLDLQYDPPRSFTLKNVEFDSGKSTLKPISFPNLNELVDLMKLKPTTEIEIRGHTDNVGNAEANLKLSEARAKAVVDYIVTKGIEKKRLSFKGFGDKEPKETNDTPEGRQKNRRTEANIIKD
ncbi:MAG: OmpA family protein [Bacteroidetes bacterium]|nr:MAG: OmpA family protein [Bacteroidota bacterium]TAG85759.1 MAG: OmpA family protein [Bacteroidota bacterium]